MASKSKPNHSRLLEIDHNSQPKSNFSASPISSTTTALTPRRTQQRLTKPSGLQGGRFICLCPTECDRIELGKLQRHGHTEIVYLGGDVDSPDFGTIAFIEETVTRLTGQEIDGVVMSDDGAAVVCAIVAERLGLPGTDPRIIMHCQNKYEMRLFQNRVMPSISVKAWLHQKSWGPEATASLPFPLFAKPVRSFLSMYAKTVTEAKDLDQLYSKGKEFMSERHRQYNDFARLYGEKLLPDPCLLLETPVHGKQVTVEGYAVNGQAHIFGITDSVMYPETSSFSRFDLPSHLPPSVQLKMHETVADLMNAIGYAHGLFNVELFYNPDTGRLTVIEVNPRQSTQLADLFERVIGINPYQVSLNIARGRNPLDGQKTSQYRYASSFVPRAFGVKRVISVPTGQEIDSFYRCFPDGLLRILCHAGEDCSASQQDLDSYRYAIINLGADSPEELNQKYAKAISLLTFRFQ